MAAPKQNQNALGNSGRPTGYQPEYAAQAEKLCRLGATDFELADFFGIGTSTLYRWRNEHPEFADATRVGKGPPDDRVERSFFNRCVGYSFESEKVFQYQGEVVRATVIEHVPPDPNAALNWLKNRRPDTWRDKTEIEMSVTDGLAARLARARARREKLGQERGDEPQQAPKAVEESDADEQPDVEFRETQGR